MKNFLRTKAIFLLTVFFSYFALSCVSEKDNRTSIETTISNIQTKLKNKDYSNSHGSNANQELKDDMKRALNHLSVRGKLRSGQMKRVFRLTSMSSPTVDETISFGIDDPANFDAIVNEATVFFNGEYSSSYISNTLSSMNSSLVNYPMTYSGANQLLTDKVNDGTITQNQRLIIEAQLDAIVNASTTTEVLNILNTVSQEVAGSQLSQNEVNSILTMNAGVEGAIEAEAFAWNNTPNGHFHQAGLVGGIIGAALFAVGLYSFIVGGNAPSGSESEGRVFLGLLSMLAGMAVALMSIDMMED